MPADHSRSIQVVLKPTLQRLLHGNRLTRAEARDLMLRLAEGSFPAEQIAALTTIYHLRGITAPELAGFSDAFREKLTPLVLDGRETIDVVGTGGDGLNSFNISTCTCFVLAGAGYPVTKHGSYGVSSISGSSNVLIELGYRFITERDELLRQLDQYNLTFLHAPLWHPAMKTVVPVRRALGMKTFFNLLGPLLNPADPTYALLGTSHPNDAALYQRTLQTKGHRHFAIVHALDGYDEISLTGSAKVWRPEGEELLRPEDFGLYRHKPVALHGGNTVAEAAEIFRNILRGEGTTAQREVVLANAALGIQLFHPARALPDCVAEAAEALDSGAAFDVLRGLTDR